MSSAWTRALRLRSAIILDPPHIILAFLFRLVSRMNGWRPSSCSIRVLACRTAFAHCIKSIPLFSALQWTTEKLPSLIWALSRILVTVWSWQGWKRSSLASEFLFCTPSILASLLSFIQWSSKFKMITLLESRFRIAGTSISLGSMVLWGHRSFGIGVVLLDILDMQTLYSFILATVVIIYVMYSS